MSLITRARCNPLPLGLANRADYRFGREPMTDRIAAGTPFAFLSHGTGAFASIAPVGIDLPERSH